MSHDPRVFARLADLERLIGQEIGLSDWIEVDQRRIDLFADAPKTTSGSTSTRHVPRRGRSAPRWRTASSR